jgi:hypothetical protein
VNNHSIDLSQNQIMWCIVYHNDVMGFEVLVLHITLWKALIVYHKSNDVPTMKKHVEIESKTPLKNSLKM